MLAETLERFNRKERHWLIRDALGPAAAKLDESFLKRVEQAVRSRDPGFHIDLKARWAIDYHLDWLVAALHILEHGEASARQPRSNGAGLVKGNQQDIDLIIVSGTTLVLVEAKGVGSWPGGGLKEKVDRLRSMTPCLISHNGRAGDFSVHFVLCSPHIGGELSSEDWPEWAKSNGKPVRMQLHVAPPRKRILKVERCDGASRRDAEGKHWRVLEDMVANMLPKVGEADS